MKKLLLVCICLFAGVATFCQSDDDKQVEKKDFSSESMAEAMEKMAEAMERMFRNDSLFSQFQLKLRELELDERFKNFDFEHYIKDFDRDYLNSPEMKNQIKDLEKNLERLAKELDGVTFDFDFGFLNEFLMEIEDNFDHRKLENNEEKEEKKEKKEGVDKQKKNKKI